MSTISLVIVLIEIVSLIGLSLPVMYLFGRGNIAAYSVNSRGLR